MEQEVSVIKEGKQKRETRGGRKRERERERTRKRQRMRKRQRDDMR